MAAESDRSVLKTCRHKVAALYLTSGFEAEVERRPSGTHFASSPWKTTSSVESRGAGKTNNGTDRCSACDTSGGKCVGKLLVSHEASSRFYRGLVRGTL